MVADVLEPAVGDSYEFLRLCFDITFFFVVVVILLAIIQGLLPCHTLFLRALTLFPLLGLIVDAFGQLRDQEDAVAQEMQVFVPSFLATTHSPSPPPHSPSPPPAQTKCFICGLGNNEFDHIPHGFDNHINKDHCIAHYM